MPSSELTLDIDTVRILFSGHGPDLHQVASGTYFLQLFDKTKFEPTEYWHIS